MIVEITGKDSQIRRRARTLRALLRRHPGDEAVTVRVSVPGGHVDIDLPAEYDADPGLGDRLPNVFHVKHD